MKQIVQKIVLSTLFLGTLHASKVSIKPNLVEDNKKIASEIRNILDAYRDSKALKELKKTLENSSFDLNTPLDQEKTALAKASEYGKLKVAQWLVIDKGVNVNTKDNLDFTPLHLTIAYSIDNALELVKLLVENGAKIDAKNIAGHTALHLSANADTELMCYLLDHGANIEAKDNYDETVLDLVVKQSVSRCNKEPLKLKNLKCLIDHGAKIRLKTFEFAYTSEIKKCLQFAQDERNKNISDAKLK